LTLVRRNPHLVALMKSISFFIASLIFTASAFAETDFPRGSFETPDLEKAKVTATTEKKEIAFVYTDKTSDCGLCQNAAAAYISAVKSKAVIVYVNSKAKDTEWQKLPEIVKQALKQGKFIPKIVVTDAAVTKVCASLTYEDYKADNTKSIRGLKKALKAK
jgi:hypothetical protein